MTLRFEISTAGDAAMNHQPQTPPSLPRWLSGLCTTQRALSVDEGRSAKALEPPTQGRWGREDGGAEIIHDLKTQRRMLR